jgi:hypothetical protein
MSEEIQKVTKETIAEATMVIEKVVKACDIVKLGQLAALEQAITIARGMNALKRVFTEALVVEVFMPLQGTTLGFVTDRDSKGGYEAIDVRNCWIQGTLWGLQPINNELNIIADRPYAAKNGLERKVREATRGLIIRPGVPVATSDGKTALLPMRATWTFEGKIYNLVKDVTTIDGAPFDERYAIRVNAGMGPDAVIGKAHRKVYRDILQMITNGAASLADGEVMDAVGEVTESKPVAPPERDGKRMHLGNKRNEPEQRDPGQEG